MGVVPYRDAVQEGAPREQPAPGCARAAATTPGPGLRQQASSTWERGALERMGFKHTLKRGLRDLYAWLLVTSGLWRVTGNL